MIGGDNYILKFLLRIITKTIFLLSHSMNFACQAEERHVDILGRLLYTAKLVAKQEGLDDGFRIVINDGPSGCKYSLTVAVLFL